ncbi:hypothetical protein NDA01_25440 [Trichocoleus desertorum AS-A10]|uniref:hypothetical protein n=1 Tax=Trichocoleus desertorum TaxID=1481672 RepID=UPI0032976AA0
MSTKSMKQHRLHVLPLLPIISVLLYHTILASPASAGGSDSPRSTQITEDAQLDKMLNAKNELKEQFQTFDWRHWSQPYSKGDNLCREHDGNIVCLTLEALKKLRW